MNLRLSAPATGWPFLRPAGALLCALLILPALSEAKGGGLAFVQPLASSLVFRAGQTGAIGVAKGDFNGDGKLDLAVTGKSNLNPPEEGGFVYVLLGLGDGRFAAPRKIAVPRTASNQQAFAYGLLAKDFDGDGEVDLLTVSSELREVLFLKGLGNGDFGPFVRSPTANPYEFVQAGDVNGDGVLDIVALTDPGFELLSGDGEGGFASLAVRTGVAGATDAILRDLDGDGDGDLLISQWGEFQMRAFFNEGGGQFPATGTPISNGGKQGGGFFMGRFDGDALDDIVAAGPFGTCNGWVILRGLGSGAFKVPDAGDCIQTPATSAAWAYGIKRFAENVPYDLDDDGDDDLVFFGPGNSFVRALQRGDGAFDVDMWARTSGPGFDWPGHGAVDCLAATALVSGDFNGDGRSDVVVAGQNGNLCRPGGVSVVLGTTDGGYRSPRFVRAPTFNGGARAFLLGDFIEDGNLDLLTQRAQVHISRGGGDGTFAPPEPGVPGTACTRDLQSGRFNEDDHLDFACVSNFGVDAQVGFGDGNGGFVTAPLPAAREATNLVSGDFNEDGLVDFGVLNVGGCNAICSSASLFIHLAQPTTPRTYERLPQTVEFGPPSHAFARGLATGDFNHDGHLDVVFHSDQSLQVGTGEDRFLIARGRGDGTFLAPLSTLGEIFGVSDYKPFDFDRDGRLDLLAVTSGGIHFIRGNGDATFQDPVFYPTTAGNGTEAEIAHLDGDGREDVLLSSGFFGFSSPLAVFKGNGDGTFQTRRRFPTGYDATRGVEVGDLNGDGRLDIVAAVTEGDRADNFVVLLNEADLPDLEVDAVTAPATAVPGELVTVTYTARNAAPFLADGEWDDLVYLSSDEIVDAGDLLIGTVHQARQLGAGDTYQGMLTAPLPGELPGARRVIVVADGNGNLGESNEDDNQRAAPLTVGEVTLLADGVPTMSTVKSGELRYFRYLPQPGSALQFSATFEVGNQADFYTRFDRLPSRDRFDLRYPTGGDTLQTLTVPSTLDGTYYVLVYGGAAAGAVGRPFSITARELGLAITSLSRMSGSNRGAVSFSIDGAKFTPGTDFTLVSGATVRRAGSIVFVSPGRVDVTFDLVGLETGPFDVVASDGDRLFTLPAGFTVTNGPPGYVEGKLSVPSNMRVAWTATATVTLKNPGETDAPLSWFRLYITSGNAAFVLPDGSDSDSIYFTPDGTLARVPPEGQGGGAQAAPSMTALGTFGPGAEATLTFPYHCTTNAEGNVEMQLDELTRPEDLLDPAQMKRDLQPAWAPADAWDAVWTSFTARAGADLKQLPALLREGAKHYGAVGEPVKNVLALLMLEIERAGLTRIASRYVAGSFGRGRPAPWDVVATTDDDGTAHLRLGAALRSFHRRPNGDYRGSPGEIATLSREGGAYALREGDGTVLRFRADGKLDSVEDANGNRVTHSYNGNRVTSRTFSNGDQETFGYNAAGFVSTVTDAVGRVTTYTYDGDGHLMTESGPLDGTTAYTYHLGNNPVTRHALATVTTPDGVTRSYSYDPVHGELRHMEKNGGAEAVDIDSPSFGCHRTRSLLNGTTTVCTNALGQPARVIDGLGRLTVNRYDAGGGLTRTTWADGSSTVYGRDRNGNVNLLTARDGLTTSELIWHPFLNRLTRVRDPRGKATVYRIDARGNLEGIVDAAGREETFLYDARGRLRQATNRRGQTTLYDYDARDELISRTPAGQAPIVFGRDGRRNVTSVTDADGTTVYDYDQFDRLERVNEPSGRSLAFAHDQANRRTRSTDQDGFAVRYEYDALGRLWKLTDADGVPWVIYGYDGAGRLAREDKGNGAATVYAYDAIGRIARVENRGVGGAVQSFFQYGYDLMDRPDTLTTAEGVTRFEYDLLDQLRVVRLPDGRVIRYDYDAAGNRTVVQDGGTTTYTVNDLNQYTAAGGNAYTYDHDGNLATRSGGFTFAWDAENRLTSIAGPGVNRAYEYDAEGFLRRRTLNGVATHLQADPIGLVNLVGEYDAGGQAKARYVHGLGLVARVGAAGAAYYSFDGAGNTVALTDAGGTPVNRYDHLPFGERRSASENTPQPLAFGGRGGWLRDGDLHWARARWYDPAIGRFLGPDPLGIDGADLNLYRYVVNSPVLSGDPSGTNPLGGSFLPPPGPPLAGQSAISVVLESTPAWEYGAYGLGSGALSGSSSAYGTAEALFATGEREVARQAIQLAPRPAPAASGIANATTRVVARGGAGALARTALTRGLGLVGWGIGVYSATRFGIEHTAAGRALDNYVYNKFLSKDREYLYPKDKTLEAKSLAKAVDCYGRENDPDCKLYFERVRAHEKGKTRKTRSRDPNDIQGPPGFGPENWISPEQPFPYIIRFENLAAATAPAAEVTITQTLDADFDPATFEIASFGWAAVRVEVEPGTIALARRIDVRDTIGLYVDVEATFDPATRLMRWTFKAIDPDTGELPGPESPIDGFLLPNDGTGRGEGFVGYRVRPRAELPTGTIVDAEARIVFDDNEHIDTPAIFHTLDGERPTSAVAMLAETTAGGRILLSWSGMDAGGSGLASYAIWVSVDGEPYSQLLFDTTQTSLAFDGEIGRTYRFYAVATDNAGNRQRVPVVPDATTRLVAQQPSPTPTATPVPGRCPGDCDRNGQVTISELVTGVAIALATQNVSACPLLDTNGDGGVTIDEILRAVDRALGGCAA